jgi:predicted flavoprotein YhiN
MANGEWRDECDVAMAKMTSRENIFCCSIRDRSSSGDDHTARHIPPVYRLVNRSLAVVHAGDEMQIKMPAVSERNHRRRRQQTAALWNALVLPMIATLLLSPNVSVSFVVPIGPQGQRTGVRLQAAPNQPQHVAVLGGGLAGIVAATTAAEKSDTKVTLLTSGSSVLEQFCSSDDHTKKPILPDLTLDNRHLMEGFASGGRELAGILHRFSPLVAQEWLETQGLTLQETGVIEGVISKDKPLILSKLSSADMVQRLEEIIRTAGVDLITNARVVNVTNCSDGFSLVMEDRSSFKVDCLVLAGEDAPWDEIKIEKESPKDAKEKLSADLSLLDADEPLSKKEQMALEKKLQKAKKKHDKSSPAKKIWESKPAEVREPKPATPRVPTCHDLAQSLKHTIIDPAPGLFTFYVDGSNVLVQECTNSHQLIPKSRLRCKLQAPPRRKTTSGALPNNKVEGSFLIANGNELTGSAAWRLSALAARDLYEGDYRGTIHIHFAPDIGGVDEIENLLWEMTVSNPARTVASSCPLFHREIDYDDYDFETGDFRQVVLPLVPATLWANLCGMAGISTNLSWSEVSKKALNRLSHLLVDSPLPITGVRPIECVTAGGVELQEIDMTTCQSRLVPGLFLCGTTMNAHGFDGGFNPLACMATGYAAGSNAMAFCKETISSDTSIA